jgi:hypothetical protein
MAAINFPPDPAVDDLFTWNSKRWRWTGLMWASAHDVVGGMVWETKSADFNAETNFGYFVLVDDVEVTLPATPDLGMTIAISVPEGVTGVVILRNGEDIMGLAEDMTLDINPTTVTLVFLDATFGWRIV